jgi:tRNA-dihydrouridine synthase 1
MEERELVERIVRRAKQARDQGALKVPVTVKIRVFDDVERTVSFARMLEESGASMVAVHGRTRMQTHHEGRCSWWVRGLMLNYMRV